MVAIFKLKKNKANACIFCIAVSKFSYWKNLNPIILLVIDKSSEINYYCTLLPLSLAINLRIKSDKELLLNFQEVTKR